ncbi:hypothetical protein V2J09_004028 [Rumex salicifolius]
MPPRKPKRGRVDRPPLPFCSANPVLASPSPLASASVSASASTSISASSPTPNLGNTTPPVETPTRKRTWNAPIWKHYEVHDGSEFDDLVPRAICKYCSGGLITAPPEKGTSNFLRHFETCPSRLSNGGEVVLTRDGKLMNKGFGTDYTKFATKSEVEAYFDEIKENPNKDLDVLSWWKTNALKFPSLSRMARDILSIPITTIASDSAFSMRSRVITRWRSSLHKETVEALLTTRSWLYGLDIEEDVQDNL